MESPEIGGGGERWLKLFGVRILDRRGHGGEEEEEEEVMRKSSSTGDLACCEPCNGNVQGETEKGYLSDGGPIGGSRRTRGAPERKRGFPWTEEEHRSFLTGLKKLGKGDWRGISREFVRTRTPTQVASHAQKYFLRQSSQNKKKRRSSLFDVVPDVSATDVETDPALSSSENHPAGAPSLDPVLAVYHGAEDSHASTRMASFTSSLYPLHVQSFGSMKDQEIPFSSPEQSSPQFHTDSAAFVPDFLTLSLRHPHCPTQSYSALPPTESNDLELRIAPPLHNGLPNLSSQCPGGIRAV